MPNADSYYDWELRFKKKTKSDNSSNDKKEIKEKDFNSLGIQEKILKEYLKTWKKKNLS